MKYAKLERHLKKIKLFVGSFFSAFTLLIIILLYNSNPNNIIDNLGYSNKTNNINSSTNEFHNENNSTSNNVDSENTNSVIEEVKVEKETIDESFSKLDLINKSKILFESIDELKEDEDKVTSLKEVVIICDEILKNDKDNIQILERKLISILSLANLHVEKLDLFNFYDEAQKTASIAISIDQPIMESMSLEYYYGQSLYEMGYNSTDSDIALNCYKKSIEVFRTLKEYNRYWSYHYILSCTDRLYLMTDDVSYLEEVQSDVLEIEISEYNGQYQERLTRMLADYYFRMGTTYFQVSKDNYLINLNNAEFYIKFGIALGKDSEYYKGLLSIVEGMKNKTS